LLSRRWHSVALNMSKIILISTPHAV
ncbi:TPA: phage tail protein, partial [Escherichia coli]|nr:phage tail protein [Escherichia coli]